MEHDDVVKGITVYQGACDDKRWSPTAEWAHRDSSCYVARRRKQYIEQALMLWFPLSDVDADGYRFLCTER